MNHRYVSSIMEAIRKQDLGETFNTAKSYAKTYRDSIDKRRVYPDDEAIQGLHAFDQELNERPESPDAILEMLNTYGSPATVAQTGGRYFGFVCGSVIPSALPTKWLADVWDQNPAMFVLSPIASKIESVVEKWVIDLLKLPKESSIGYVSGSSTATLVGICTARNHLLMKKGYDPIKNGLSNLPALKVVVGEGAHSTVFKGLSLAGLGAENLIRVPVDDQGCMQADKLPYLDDMTLVIAQAGHVSSGGFDPFIEICQKANQAGAWVHIDGAFGLWAKADQRFDHLTAGIELADSWSVDGHKTLNAPYDNGIIICKHTKPLIDAMQMSGSYIITSDNRDGMMYTPEMSRRARAIDLWSTLKGLGIQGVGDMVYEFHTKSNYFATGLKEIGLNILNNVVFNQIIVYAGSNEKTLALIDAIQKSGVLWLGGAKWEGKDIIRISVCSYRTTYEDIDICVTEIKRLMDTL